jgi:hypothetical protein
MRARVGGGGAGEGTPKRGLQEPARAVHASRRILHSPLFRGPANFFYAVGFFFLSLLLPPLLLSHLLVTRAFIDQPHDCAKRVGVFPINMMARNERHAQLCYLAKKWTFDLIHTALVIKTSRASVR